MSSPEPTDPGLLEVIRRQDRLLAQELHDTICQSLVGVSLLVQAATRACRKGRDVPLADLLTIGDRLDTVIEQSRIFMQAQLIENQPETLPQSLQYLADLAPPFLHCSVVKKGELVIPNAAVAQTLYRVARESLQNIVREANATHVTLTLRQRPHGLELKIVHDGRRYADKSGNCILSGDGMLERLARAAGLDWQVRAPTKSTVALTCGLQNGLSPKPPSR